MLRKANLQFWEEARELTQKLHQTIPKAFPMSIDGRKIQTCSQKSDESAHDNYNTFQVVFKENSGFPSDVDSTWVTFNSLFVNGLNRNLSLLVKRARMEWEMMDTLDLVNLVNQLAHMLD